VNIPASKAAALRDMRSTIARARVLRNRLAVEGKYEVAGQPVRPLPNPDKRDATVFIFFEAAAAFEAFCYESFILAVRTKFNVGPKVADKLGGKIDGGTVLGWAAPPELVKRSKRIFGKRYFLSIFEAVGVLPADHYDWLKAAHRLRNRIAHPTSQSAINEIKNIRAALGIPAAMRGAGPGRILSDYPVGAAAGDRWFHRFLLAYESFANLVDARL